MADDTNTPFAIKLYSDIGCPWAHIAVHRLTERRAQVGLGGEFMIDHRTFPLEVINCRPTPKAILDIEVPICAELEPDAGWSFDPDPWTYPVSTLAAHEVVHAAKAQHVKLAERVDLALRRAMFADWRCLAVLGVAVDIASTIEGIDVDELWREIRTGSPRRDIWYDLDIVRGSEIPGSPTLVLPDGTVHHNPGIDIHWTDGPGSELIVDGDDPSIYDDIVNTMMVEHVAD